MKLEFLQMCRGFAAISVVLAHSSAYLMKDSTTHRLLSVGTVGVELFFVLSGFIIHYSFVTLHNKDQTIINHVIKRLKRIYPLYWASTLLLLLGILLANLMTSKPILELNYFTLTNVVKNLSLYPFRGWPEEQPINPVAWTLSFEILFYLAFILFIYSPRLYVISILVWSIAIVNNSGLDSTDAPFLLNPLILLFFLGQMAAFVKLRNKHQENIIVSVFLISSVMIIIEWYFESSGNVVNRIPIFGLAFALLIFSLAKETPVKKNRFVKVLLYLGDASYSIYLIHFWVVTFYFILLFRFTNSSVFSAPVVLFGAFLGVISGLIAYKLIEKPITLLITSK